MSYIALARQWRPRTFSQLLGQDHIKRSMINSLNQGRLHHAYLFTGTRGVGKTSIARILAKALNCEQGINPEPCLQCDACIAIEQGRFIDLIEVDGASRTRVEDTREILENVQYAPTSARFKIYIIDEVHMLSQHSFNALLKTLEEPPEHVKFFLATTDPQKLPVTVLSRCLQFHLRELHPDTIALHLEHILQQEKLAYDATAVKRIAEAARGSMRDALSLLDQVIAYSADSIQLQDVNDILGYTQQDYALQLLLALADQSPQQLIAISQSISKEGGHFLYVLDSLLTYLHQMTLCQHLTPTTLLLSTDPNIQQLSTQFTPEDTQLFYQIILKGTENIHLAPNLQVGFEMTLLRMYTFKPAGKPVVPPLVYQSIEAQAPSVMIVPNIIVQPIQKKQELIQPAVQTPIQTQPEAQITQPFWDEIVHKLNLTGLARTAAEQTEWESKSGNRVVLRLSKAHQSLFTSAVSTRIEAALSHYFNETIKVSLEIDTQINASPAQQRETAQAKQQENAELALRHDPVYQQLQQTFSAELVKNSIETKDDRLLFEKQL